MNPYDSFAVLHYQKSIPISKIPKLPHHTFTITCMTDAGPKALEYVPKNSFKMFGSYF